MKKKLLVLSPLYIALCHNVTAMPFEVLHWWTAEGEYQSKQLLIDTLKVHDIEFKDFAIIGEGGESAVRVLQMRSLAGNPPEAAQIKGPDIAEWKKLSMLVEIDLLTNTTLWDSYLPQVVLDDITVDQHYMAIPVNIHRVNWLWINNKIFKKYGLSAPKSWDHFFAIADFLKSKGVNPLVLGGTPWQDALLFESVAISVLGPEKYKQAFVEFKQSVITSKEMLETFRLYKQLHRYTSAEQQGKDWFLASETFINDQAAMFFMGDWVKGGWSDAGKVAMQDYTCVPAPGTAGVFSYNVDSFVLFKKHLTNTEQRNHGIFVNSIMSQQFQIDFSLAKGSIPVRTDTDLSQFDACSLQSAADFKRDVKVPSFTQNMASTSHQQIQITQLVSNYFNSNTVTAEEAVHQLSVIVKALTSK